MGQKAEQAIRTLAAAHGVTAASGPLDALARDINRLSDGDDTEPDDVMMLMRNLRRRGLVEGVRATRLLAEYMRAKAKS